MPKPPTVGIFIKEYLLNNGPSSTYDIWLEFREYRHNLGHSAPSYYSFYQNYIYRLKRLGLLKAISKERTRRGFDRVMIDVVAERLEDPAWNNVQKAYKEEFL